MISSVSSNHRYYGKDNNISSIIMLFALIVGGSLVYESDYSNLSIIFIIFVLSLYAIIKGTFLSIRKDNSRTLRLFIYALVFLVSVFPFSSDYLQGFIRIVQYISCILAFFVGSHISLKKEAISFIKLVIYTFTIISLLYWFFSGTKFINYSFFFRNANTYSCVLLCQFGFLSIFSKMSKTNIFDIIILCIIATLTYFTNSRAAFLSIILYVILFFFLNHRHKKGKNIRFLGTLFLIGILLFVVGFTYIYPQLFNTSLGNKLQKFSLEHFDKLFFSGRHVIWSRLIEAIHNKPLFGYGLDATPSSIYSTVLSSHNLYLQTILQVGFAGFALLFVPLLHIAIKMIKDKNVSSLSISSLCFLLVVLFHECFEVSLTQNLIICGLQMWFIIGMGRNQYLSINSSDNQFAVQKM